MRLAKLNELSRQAERTTEAMHSAQLDLNNKLAAQQDAEAKHDADQAAVDTAKSELATFQSAVDKFAAAQYMGGRTSGMDAMLTADSPQRLIDQLSVQRVMASEMSVQMNSYRTVSAQAAKAQEASAKSAADAKTAAEQAAAVRADLQSKQSQLQVQMAVVKSQYLALTPGQREALAAVPPAPPPPPVAPPAPEDPAIVAAPPGGIPPGDVAPPEGAIAPEAPGGEGDACGPGRADQNRLALLVGWIGTQRVRLLGPGDVGLPAGGHFAAALQPGAGPGRPAGGHVADAAGRRGQLLLRRVAFGDLHRRRHDGARVHLRHAGASGTGEQCPDLQRPPVLNVGFWACC